MFVSNKPTPKHHLSLYRMATTIYIICIPSTYYYCRIETAYTIIPLDDIPELESIIPVVEVGHSLQATLSDVLWYAEGAVGQ